MPSHRSNWAQLSQSLWGLPCSPIVWPLPVWPPACSQNHWAGVAPEGQEEQMKTLRERTEMKVWRGAHISKIILCSQNKLAVVSSLSATRMYHGGKRINSTWPSNLITTRSTAALLRPPALRDDAEGKACGGPKVTGESYSKHFWFM